MSNHDSFQKAEIFLSSGGQKGPQIDFLRPGTYNILTSMFNIQFMEAVNIIENQIGIVEAKEGRPLDPEDYVAVTPPLPNGFQDAQMFLNSGGRRGPQESVLRPGTYYINTMLFDVKARPATIVRQGEVALLIANIGITVRLEIHPRRIRKNRDSIPVCVSGMSYPKVIAVFRKMYWDQANTT